MSTAEELKLQLEDTQQSLQAALARIEAFRLREKLLVQENAQLRNKLYGTANDKKETQNDSTNATTSTSAGESEVPSVTQRSPSYAAMSPKQLDVVMHFVGRKVSGGLIISKDAIEFVEVKARITAQEFLGISAVADRSTHRDTANPPSSAQIGKKKKSGFCCFAPLADDDGVMHQSIAEEVAAKYGLAEDPRAMDGTWSVLWQHNGVSQQLTFDTTNETRALLHKHTEVWLTRQASGADGDAGDDEGMGQSDDAEIVVPQHMALADTMPRLSEPSQVLTSDHLRAICGSLPPRHLLRDWSLLYSTGRHGISLQTLYRKAANYAPTVLVVKDHAGYIFGAFTPEAWKIAPRFYGSGETFVFQVEPHRIMYPWRMNSRTKNDYFMYSTPDCMAVGGAGRFAIWLDSELLNGSSGTCGTFGSPCLAGSEEYRVLCVELWGMV